MPKKWRTELWIMAIAAFVLVLDQLTKALVVRYLPPQVSWNPIPLLRPIVTLTHVRNTGAAFGLFPGQGSLLAIIAPVAMVAILFYYRQLPYQRLLVRASVALQWGGAAGNLIDRLRVGYVIDFVDLRLWPVFNIADTSIVIGAVILACYLLFLADKETARSPRVPEASPITPAER